jgi:hypothetical protein
MNAPRPHPPGVKVVVATLSPGHVDHNFFESWSALLRYDATSHEHSFGGGGTIALQSGPRVAEARSSIVATFLSEPMFETAEWLLQIDSDMAFDRDALCRLLGYAYDGKGGADPSKPTHRIMSGLAFSGGKGKVYPTVYKLGDTTKGEPWLDRVLDYPRDSLIQVGATGGAFIMIHRSVFYAMLEQFGKLPDGSRNPYPWYVEGGHREGHPIGEDIAFCVRANACGIPVMMHTGVKTKHYKPIAIDEDLYDGVYAGTEVPT